MAQAAQAGLTPETFWRLTPRELANYWEGRAYAEKMRWKRALWHAWHAEALQRTKHLPNLQQIMSRMGGNVRKEYSVEELHQKILVAHNVLTLVTQQQKKTG